MDSGIYMIRNNIDNKVYIGQSINLKRRINTHKLKLRSGTHDNSYIQNSVDKYGYMNFEFSILEYCIEEDLDDKEKYWIARYDSMNRDNGYNRESGGNFGRVYSEERKNTLKGKGNPMYGKHHSKESIERIRMKNRASSNKLTENDVSNIKKRLYEDESQTKLCEEYIVTISTINKIAKCKNWNWVKPELNNELINLADNMKEKRNKEIQKLFDKGESLIDISRITGAEYQTIKNILGEGYDKYKEKNVSKRNELIDNVIIDFNNGMIKSDLLEKYNISVTTYGRFTRQAYQYKKESLQSVVCELKEKGMLNKDIAKELNIHRTTVTEYLQLMNKGNYKVNDRMNAVIEDFENGLGKAEIIEKYKISKTTYARYTKKVYKERREYLIKEVKDLKGKGMTHKDIAEKLKIDRTTITEYLRMDI